MALPVLLFFSLLHWQVNSCVRTSNGQDLVAYGHGAGAGDGTLCVRRNDHQVSMSHGAGSGLGAGAERYASMYNANSTTMMGNNLTIENSVKNVHFDASIPTEKVSIIL